MSTTLPLFWNLSSASKKERIDASVKLVSSLEQFQSQFIQKPPAEPVPSNSGSEDEDEDEDGDAAESKSDGLNLLNAQDVSYSIRRLIRGLASPRESSRLGFAVALTELLSRVNTVTCIQIYTLIMDSTKHQGSMNGQDERDVLFARLFGILSLVQSGLIVRTQPLPSSGSATTLPSSLEAFQQTLDTLVGLGDEKSWLRESAWFAISLLVDVLKESDVSWKDEATSAVLDSLFIKNATWSTEKVALALKCQDLCPERDWKPLVAGVFKSPEILNNSNLAAISRILKESTIDEDGAKDPTKAPSGAWKPQLNFSWDIILGQLLPGPNSRRSAKGSFQDFYRVVVDESLFSSTSSPQRKYWGFQVFQKALKRITEDSMPMLFTKNFMRTWINHLSKKDRYLHKVALQTVSEVQVFVKDRPQLAFSLILQLTGVHGSQQFDKLTKTKTVESILSSLDAKGIQEYIDYLLTQVNETEADAGNVSTINSRRTWVVEQLCALIRNQKLPREDAWIQTILDWLTVNGLFVVKKKSSKSSYKALRNIPAPLFSDNLQKTCRERLLVCLGDLSSQTNIVVVGEATKRTTAVASDGEFWIAKVIATMSDLEEDSKHVTPLGEADEDDLAVRTKVKEVAAGLEKVEGDTAKGARLLLLGMLLQQNCDAAAVSEDDESRMDDDALQACIDGASRLCLSEGKKRKQKKKVLEEETSEDPVDVLVDTIIGFLEKSTSYMRTVGNQVFSLLSESVKETTIDLIVTQLERRDPSQLMAEDDEPEDEVMDVDEVEDGQEDASDKEDDESDPSEEEDQDDGNDSNEEDADVELRNRIEEALRVNGIEPATGDTDSEEEELMDDDQMMAIDEQLAQVFKSRREEKNTGKSVDVQREATHFKNRVLDLVDTFIRKQPSSPLIFRLIQPLLDLVVGCGQDERQLADKAKGILRSRIGKAKENPASGDKEQLVQLASNIHNQARKSNSSDLQPILSLCSVYLTKTLIHIADASAVALYQASLDFIRRFPTLAWKMRQDLLDASEKAINAYRQSQVFQMLELLVGQLRSTTLEQEEATSFMSLLNATILRIGKGALTESSNLTTTHIRELLKLAIVSAKQTRKISLATVESIWPPEDWISLRKSIATAPKFKNSTALPKMCEQVARTARTTPEPKKHQYVPGKRKAEAVNGHGGRGKRKKVQEEA